MINFKKTLLATAALAFISTPAMAGETHKTKEVKKLVGYNVTEQINPDMPKAKFFKKMDSNADGQLNFKEYQRYSTRDDEYGTFLKIDTNNDRAVTLNEFLSADVTKGNTHFKSEKFGMVKGTNLKTKPLPEPITYFVPAEGSINVDDIEPAAR